MTSRASGTFDVEVTPQPSEDDRGDPPLGRMLLHKRFHGDLEATGKGQMLTAGSYASGSHIDGGEHSYDFEYDLGEASSDPAA